MTSSKHYKESMTLLVEGSLRAIPLNIILATLLAIDLVYNNVPALIIEAWIFGIVFISMVRSLFCWKIIKWGVEQNKIQSTLLKFFFLTFVMGSIWGTCYFITLPYLNDLHEFIIILVFGGMCAGAIASLSVYLPAYYAYVFPMLIPVIIYNYALLDLDRTILATMFLIFIAMLIISARINNRLLNQNFRLFNEKELLISELKVMTITDSLTGLYNRRYFDTLFPQEFNRARRNQYFLSLVSIDADNFKLINDNLGHPFGDKVLISIADLLKKIFRRSNDILFRLGGDEFAIIIANQPIKDTISICQAIKNPFKTENNYGSNEQLLMSHVTLSIGIVYIHFESSASVEHAIIVADKALYQAKKNGKNQIVVKKLL
ncbi:GGDEF domain-containing protein [Legionella pneumophila]|uniref:GGDEF domain-containing protein n=1 Tax=Legionella pneumophila TaxID=446 RepID=UPI00048D8A58|nr:GGDEF domain-containing protein [Legionella pneumophila]HAT1820523.1 diguanylate cyclase [Legionella pneumophila]HAT1866780.1 diguanylate cyclase [Legionella pneumophila]HAT1906907.1 diguanylate cyclase [Legionella pneumophila]HAT1983576.1 diguanylate cyclase [Legionella pneumophila]HCR5299061.1 diguanylate cyclase [Legionella pneumophila]